MCNRLLVYDDAPRHDHNYTPFLILLSFNYNNNNKWLCADVNVDIWNAVLLTLDEQLVRWYNKCMFEFECVITWYTMHHDTIAIAHSRAIQLQWQRQMALLRC